MFNVRYWRTVWLGAGSTKSRRDLGEETGIGGVAAVIEAGGISWQARIADTERTRAKSRQLKGDGILEA